MNKKYSFVGTIAIAAALTLSACGAGSMAGSPATPETAASPSSDMTSGMAMSEAGSMAHMIHIQDGKFIDADPVAAGASVPVMNMDDTAQTIISDDGTSFTISVPAGGMVDFKAPMESGSYPFHSENGNMQGTLTVQAGEPPVAATMVCSDLAKANIKDILGLTETPTTKDSWDGTNYVCTYPLEVGEFTMTVTEAGSDANAVALAKKLAGTLAATAIEGLANLGLPGYESEDGSVVFAKDSMVLHVDATAFPATVGPDKVAASQFAYQLATTILGCWTAHHSS